MANLYLLRHGESKYNAKGLWTGLTDISMNSKGFEESRQAANKLKNVKIDLAYTSNLKRSKETLEEIKKTLGLTSLIAIENQALDERDYGIFTGKNKWKIEKEVGEERFKKIRRGWDVPIPDGETLKDVYNRVVPYYQNEILPKLKEGKNVLIVAHGNSLRALAKYLENISDKDIENVEIKTGEIYHYAFNDSGNIVSRKIISSN